MDIYNKAAVTTRETKDLGKSVIMALLKDNYFIWPNYTNDD